jgi:hypothetical protein
MASLPLRLFIVSVTVLAAMSVRADVTDTAAERQFFLASATVKLTLPRGDWIITREQRRPDETAVYYALESQTRGLIFSVYIDKSASCKTATACRELALANPAFRDAKELKTLEVGMFSVSQFYLDQPQNLKISQANVLASAYVDGYWFNIHISKGDTTRPDEAPLIDLLKEVSIK